MPEEGITSVFSVIALISALLAGLLYLLSIFMSIRHLTAKKKKGSGAGIACIVFATIFAVTAYMLYSGISIWFLLAVIIVDSIIVTLLTL